MAIQQEYLVRNIPEKVAMDLRWLADERGCTIHSLVLEGLRACGYPVRKGDFGEADRNGAELRGVRPRERRVQDKQVGVVVPLRVAAALRAEALERGVPMRVLLLEALQAVGVKVKKAEMEDRRSSKRKRITYASRCRWADEIG